MLFSRLFRFQYWVHHQHQGKNLLTSYTGLSSQLLPFPLDHPPLSWNLALFLLISHKQTTCNKKAIAKVLISFPSAGSPLRWRSSSERNAYGERSYVWRHPGWTCFILLCICTWFDRLYAGSFIVIKPWIIFKRRALRSLLCILFLGESFWSSGIPVPVGYDPFMGVDYLLGQGSIFWGERSDCLGGGGIVTWCIVPWTPFFTWIPFADAIWAL